jgi:Zn-dependent protease
MESKELTHILAAIVVLTAIISFLPILNQNYTLIPKLFVFAALIILIPILAKKALAFRLDANVEHEIWLFQRIGYKAHQKFKRPILAGIIIPILFSIFTLGIFKVFTFLTYETKALKRRAARRHGYYSFTEMTELHHALIGASGVLALMLLSLIAYLLNFPELAKYSTFYAFWNLIPFSKLDGTQILLGSRPIYISLAVIVLIALSYAIFLI